MKKRRSLLPVSYNKLADADFRLIVHIVQNVLKFIRKMSVLRDPDDRRKRLWGYLAEGHEEAYIAHSKHNPAVKNLMHEALHALYPHFVTERQIKSREKLLWSCFNEAQKRYLRQFVPKHYSKKNP